MPKLIPFPDIPKLQKRCFRGTNSVCYLRMNLIARFGELTDNDEFDPPFQFFYDVEPGWIPVGWNDLKGSNHSKEDYVAVMFENAKGNRAWHHFDADHLSASVFKVKEKA